MLSKDREDERHVKYFMVYKWYINSKSKTSSKLILLINYSENCEDKNIV